MHPRPSRPGGLRQKALGQRIRPPGIRRRLRPENDVAELPVVADIGGGGRQQVHLGAGGRGAAIQGVLGLAGGVRQRRIHRLAAHPLAAGFVVHLLQIRAIAEPPGLRQFVLRHASGIFVVQEPGDVAPAPQRLGELDAVHRGASDALQLGRVGLAADGLGVQERGEHGLLGGSGGGKRWELVLNLPGLRQLAGKQPRPIRWPATAAGIRHVRQILHRFGNARFARRGEQGCGADQRACIPLPGGAQRRREGSQKAPRALERRQLRPLAVEHVREIRVEGEAGEEPRFLRRTILGHRFVQLGQLAHHADHVGAVRLFVAQPFALEKTAAQHLRDIFPPNGLHAFLALAPNHREQGIAHLDAQRILLVRIGCQQRRHHRRLIHLANRRHQMLEEIDDARLPLGIQPDLLAGVHEHFVHQHQRGQPAFGGHRQQLRQQRLRGRGFALGVFAIGMNGS